MAKLSAPQTAPLPPGLEDEEQPLDLHGLTRTLLGGWWLILLAALGLAAVAWSLTRRLPDQYQSAAVLEIPTQTQRPIELRADAQDNALQNPEVVETLIAKFQSRVLLDRVNRKLGLATNARFLGRAPTPPATDEEVIARLRAGARVLLRARTRLVDVTFSHPDPAVAYQVDNALVTEFLAQSEEGRSGTLEAQNKVLTEKAEDLKAKVNQSELDLQRYKQSLASVSLEDRRNLVEEKLKALNLDLNNARSERLRLESDADQARHAQGSTDQLLAIPSIATDPQVVAARARLAKEEEEITALAQRYGSLHPRMIEEKAQLEAARTALADAARTAPSRIDNRFAAARAQEDGLQKAAGEQEAALLDMDAKVIPFRALQREYDSNRALFESVLQRLKESNLQLGVQAMDFNVVEPAAPARRLPSLRPLYTLAGFVFGGGLAIVGLLVRFFLRRSLSTVDAAERQLGLPALTAVPRMRRGTTPRETLAAMARPESPEAESFRTLRTALQLLAGEASASPQVILFTSAVPAEGKSVTAGNMAIAFAQLGLRTLLIDADLRRPSLDAFFIPDEPAPVGLGDFLNDHPVNIVPTRQENLHFLPAGQSLSEPAEALAGPRFGELIAESLPRYDRILIDTAPVNVVSDTLNIVAHATVVCLVVRSHSTPQREVQRAIELLKRGGSRPDGLILNYATVPTGRKYREYYQGGAGYGPRESSRRPTTVAASSSSV